MINLTPHSVIQMYKQSRLFIYTRLACYIENSVWFYYSSLLI